jgi:hypothetical protein
MDLTEWTYCFTFGRDLYIYRKGKRKLAVDGRSGKAVFYFDSNKAVFYLDSNKDIILQEDEEED